MFFPNVFIQFVLMGKIDVILLELWSILEKKNASDFDLKLSSNKV
jgi:hypothetical protein